MKNWLVKASEGERERERECVCVWAAVDGCALVVNGFRWVRIQISFGVSNRLES